MVMQQRGCELCIGGWRRKPLSRVILTKAMVYSSFSSSLFDSTFEYTILLPVNW